MCVRSQCADGLRGIFCRQCKLEGMFYVDATDDVQAHCRSCAEALTHGVGPLVTFGAFCLVVVVVVLMGLYRLSEARTTVRYIQQSFSSVWYRLTISSSLPTKAKIVIGFYQIATKIENVYDLYLPPRLRALLQKLQFGISLGIEGIPLECIGAKGYISRLLFWTAVPVLLIVVAASVAAIKTLVTKRNCSKAALLENVLPFVLRFGFLLYPV